MAAARIRVIWVTSGGGRCVDHAVSDDDMASGAVFVGVCGARFLPASMCAEPGPVCPACRLYLRTRVSMRPAEARMGVARHRLGERRGVVARLLAMVRGTTRVPSLPAGDG